jgi:outer membrane biosynthesis protein TonB
MADEEPKSVEPKVSQDVVADEEPKKVEEAQSQSEPPPAPAPEHVEQPSKDVTEEKSVIPPPPAEKPDESKELAVVESNTHTLSLSLVFFLILKILFFCFHENEKDFFFF